MPNERGTAGRYDEVLSAFAVDYRNPKSIWDRVFPVYPVDKRSDLFPVFDKERFRPTYDERATGASRSEVDSSFSLKAYQCTEHSHKTLITDVEKENANAKLNPDLRAQKTISSKLDLNLERKIVSMITTQANVYTAIVTPDWSNTTTASPQKAITTAKVAVQAACGVEPNRIAFGYEAWEKLMLVEEIREQVRYHRDLTQNDMPLMLYGLEVVVGKSLYNSAAKGKADVLTSIWSNNIFIYVAENPGWEVLTYGALLQSKAPLTVRWRDEDRSGEWVATDWEYEPKVVAYEAGYLMQPTLPT